MLTSEFIRGQPTDWDRLERIKDTYFGSILAAGAAKIKQVQAAMYEAWAMLTKDQIWKASYPSQKAAEETLDSVALKATWRSYRSTQQRKDARLEKI
ncbi:hypothetical protein MMC29_006779, partial [Sticta canariensis]|nr:hypothetical protein [Sticta canariensis]